MAKSEKFPCNFQGKYYWSAAEYQFIWDNDVYNIQLRFHFLSSTMDWKLTILARICFPSLPLSLTSSQKEPQNVTFPDIKRLIGDSFLYKEITEIYPDPNSIELGTWTVQGCQPVTTSLTLLKWMKLIVSSE